MRNPFTRGNSARASTFKAIAAALGIGTEIKLPFHMPFAVRKESEQLGKGKRIQKSRINRTSWKCNEINPRTDKKRGHLNDIIQTLPNNTAQVRCRRCGHVSEVKIKWPEREAKAAAA